MYEIGKKLMDFTLALILGIIFSPVFLATAIAIKLSSPGPILADTPERVGKNGRPFKMYKFRSMVQNAHQILRTDPKMKSLYEKYKRNSYKLKEDPRITQFGKFIRKHSFDEIPQIINVLKGEMSIVGPRAYYPDELTAQQKKYPHTKKLVHIVLSVKPGITGSWQVSGRSEVNFDKRIKMDAEYVKRNSLKYDIIILLKTPWAMVSGQGAM
jgi:lipopolysaccharide/colanic/teichoic acid biosynthesis glycosyltransferase